MAWNDSTTNIPGEVFGNPTPSERAFRVAEARSLNPPQTRPVPFRATPQMTGGNIAAPTIGGGAPVAPTGFAGGGFQQPGQNLVPAACRSIVIFSVYC